MERQEEEEGGEGEGEARSAIKFKVENTFKIEC